DHRVGIAELLGGASHQRGNRSGQRGHRPKKRNNQNRRRTRGCVMLIEPLLALARTRTIGDPGTTAPGSRRLRMLPLIDVDSTTRTSRPRGTIRRIDPELLISSRSISWASNWAAPRSARMLPDFVRSVVFSASCHTEV